MTPDDEAVIVPMVYGFYQSDAVDHPVPIENVRRSFHAAVEDGTLLEGFALEDESGIVGFAYLSKYFACEVGGVNMMLEEIYFSPEARGKITTAIEHAAVSAPIAALEEQGFSVTRLPVNRAGLIDLSELE